MFKKILAGVALLVFVSWISAQVETFDLPGDEVYPEGIAYNAADGTFYVSSTTDGTIFRGSIEGGDVTTLVEGEGDASPEAAYGLALDTENRLWVVGGPTGLIYVFDAESGEQLSRMQPPEADATFLNDVVVTPAGDAYITDSFRPVLFKVSSSAEGVGELEPWLDFTGTALEYTSGETILESVNLNGIASSEDGRYLVTVQMNSGELYRIDTDSKEVIQIDLGGETLLNGDGLVLDGRTLYVVRIADNEIVTVELSEDFSSGEVTARFSDPALIWPATAALAGDRLLVVNTQFNRQGEDAPPPELPFSVLSVPVSMVHSEQQENTGDEETPEDAAEDEEDTGDSDASDAETEADPSGQADLQSLMAQGEQVYGQAGCGGCHGSDGGGGMGVPLRGNQKLASTEHVVNRILHGKGAMPAFASQLSDEQIAAVATFVRNSWDNDYGSVSTQEVAAQR